jgi:hypothetical protein
VTLVKPLINNIKDPFEKQKQIIISSDVVYRDQYNQRARILCRTPRCYITLIKHNRSSLETLDVSLLIYSILMTKSTPEEAEAEAETKEERSSKSRR